MLQGRAELAREPPVGDEYHADHQVLRSALTLRRTKGPQSWSSKVPAQGHLDRFMLVFPPHQYKPAPRKCRPVNEPLTISKIAESFPWRPGFPLVGAGPPGSTEGPLGCSHAGEHAR